MEDTLKSYLKKLRENESMISMVLGGLVVVIVGVLLLNYFRAGGDKTPQITDNSTATQSGEYTLSTTNDENGNRIPTGLPRKHVVQSKEHLWAIAEKYYGSGYNWVDIAKANGMNNPNQLFVGKELEIPQAAIKDIKLASNEVVETIKDNTYTVAKGDSLWTISVKAYGDGYQWTKLYEANKDKIQSANTIEPGWVLTIPRG